MGHPAFCNWEKVSICALLYRQFELLRSFFAASTAGSEEKSAAQRLVGIDGYHECCGTGCGCNDLRRDRDESCFTFWEPKGEGVKRLLFCMLLLIGVLAACGQNSDSSNAGDVLVMNCTDAEVCSVRVDWENETLVVQNADGTALGRDEYLTFELDAVPATVTACDIEGADLASCTIMELTKGRWGIHLNCDAEGNYVMEAKEVAALTQSSAFVAGTERTQRGIVTERCMAQVRAVDSRWSFLVPSRAAIGISITKEYGESYWESEHYEFPPDVGLGDYVEIESAIEKKSGLLAATNIVKLEEKE